jgi:hypothetical protein
MPVVNATLVSEAWKQVVSLCLRSRDHQVHALTVEIVCGNEIDDLAFRGRVNRTLVAAKKATVDTVARTIFPIGLWNPRHPRSELFERYMKILPKLRRYALNRRGLYFERLINYPLERESTKVKNQLEFVISTYVEKRNHRRSALQASLYNPFIDASNSPRLGFPCLQQIGFIPTSRHDLTVLGFYPVHYIFERAYGNYLGLIHLGQFMAKEMGLNLTRVVCTTGVANFEVSASKVGTLNLP